MSWDFKNRLFLESVGFQSHIPTNKHWWFQAENQVGFINVYELPAVKSDVKVVFLDEQKNPVCGAYFGYFNRP